MPRVIANTAFGERLEEITTLQNNLKILSSNLLSKELNFYLPGKSPANIANSTFSGILDKQINLQNYYKVVSVIFEVPPYTDPNNIKAYVDVALPVSEAVNINTFEFSYDPVQSFAVIDVSPSIFNPGLTTIMTSYDPNLYNLANYETELAYSYIIIHS